MYAVLCDVQQRSQGSRKLRREGVSFPLKLGPQPGNTGFLFVCLFLWVFVVVFCLQRKGTTWMAILLYPFDLSRRDLCSSKDRSKDV